MNEIADSKEDVHEMSIYNKVQKAVYNRMHGDIEDYDRRMNSILSALKDQFRNQQDDFVLDVQPAYVVLSQ